MKILYSGFRDPSHSKFGGYDKITNIGLGKKILLSENYLFGKRNFQSHLMRIPFTLLDLHTRLLRWRFDITHLFYGEITMIFFLPYLKSKKHKTVITLHLDIEKRRWPNLFIKLLRHFDGIIVLSSQQKEYLEQKYNLISEFIPHGFIKPQFRLNIPPDANGNRFSPDKVNILTIGNNYRDFETLRNVIDFFKDSPKYRFHLVGIPQEIKAYFKGHCNVSIYPRLNNDEFYSMISKSDYGFLPLSFATANNTLLEYQFLNLQTILPNIPGVSDYAAPAPMNYFYNDFNELCSLIQSLDKPTKDTSLSKYAESNFDWSIINKRIEAYYQSLV